MSDNILAFYGREFKMNNLVQQLAIKSDICYLGTDNKIYYNNCSKAHPRPYLENFTNLVLEECFNSLTEVYREMPLEQAGWMLDLEQRILTKFYEESNN